MLSEFTFFNLNVRQRIHKTAHAVRDAERNLRSGASADAELDAIAKYAEYLKKTGHPKCGKAAASLGHCLVETGNDTETSLRIKALNFCFYELLELINEAVDGPDGQFFDPMKEMFDRDEYSVEASVRLANAAILDNLRSPFNVGSIFRSADCFGTGELALCGITPRPPLPKLERSAMGCTQWVPWRAFEKTADAVRYYRDLGYSVIAIEKTPKATPLQELKAVKKAAFIFGNEEFGITRDVLKIADRAVVIPQAGRKNSMNVSNAFALVMFSQTGHLTRNGRTPRKKTSSSGKKKVERRAKKM